MYGEKRLDVLNNEPSLDSFVLFSLNSASPKFAPPIHVVKIWQGIPREDGSMLLRGESFWRRSRGCWELGGAGFW